MNKFYKAALTVLLCATSVSSMDSPTITNPAVTANQYFQETTCFFDAIQDGNIDLVKQLLEENRDLVLRKVNGMSAIHLAIFCGQTDMAKVLYDECPESIYFQNAQGEFVITSALDLLNTYQNKKDYEFVSYVLDNPHNVLQDFMVNMMREQISKIGIEIEKKNKDSSIQDLWQQKETSFFGAIKDGNIFLIKKFLEDDKERVSRKAADMLPLYYAIGCHQIEVAKYLSDIYPESILLEGSANKKNALTRAAENGSYDFITYVFENHRKILTDVALDDFFLKYGNYEVIKSIINNKLTTVNMKDSFLKKIIDLASFNMQADVVKYMIDNNPNIKEYILKKYLKYYRSGHTYSDNKFSLEKQSKQSFSYISLVNHMRDFKLNDHDEIIQSSKFSIKFLREYALKNYLLKSNHRYLINFRSEGKQGAGIKVLVWDSFLTPPKDSGQILYSSRLDHKIPDEVRKFISEKIEIERNFKIGSHGIHVAGLIADDDFGIAPKTQIIPISEVGITVQKLTKITEYILKQDYGAKIINMSFGSSDIATTDSEYIPILKNLCQNHIVVKSAGNDGCAISRSFHQAIEEDKSLRRHLLIVSSVMKDGKTLSEFSNYFSESDLPNPVIESIGIAAPGTDIVSTIPEYNINQFDIKSGTSFAAPIVTGAIAKLMSDFPDLSITEIADLVRSGANKQGIFADRGKYGEGFLDLQKTYRLAQLYVMNKEKGIPEILKDLT